MRLTVFVCWEAEGLGSTQTPIDPLTPDVKSVVFKGKASDGFIDDVIIHVVIVCQMS